MNAIPIRTVHHQLSALDDATLSVMFKQAIDNGDQDLLEPLLQQLVIRSVPIIARAVREVDATISPRDLKAIGDEALIKVLLGLAGEGDFAGIRPLAYGIGRECALDPDRRPAPEPKFSPSRPKLRLIHG